jgi:hypothetical protein
MNGSEIPVLSVIVVIASGTTTPRAEDSLLARCLEALSKQTNAPPTEIIVPYHQRVDGIDCLQKEFPDVAFVPVADLKSWSATGGSREHHDELKTRALEVARGTIIGFLEDNEVPDENWCAHTVKAHRENYAGIGGAIENSMDRTLNWAVYYCDLGRYLNLIPSGDSTFASDANVSYKRAALEQVRSAWEQGFNEVTINAALMARGENLALRPDIIAYQQRSNLRLGPALRERYVWGRSFGAVRCKVMSPAKRIVYTVLSPLLPGIVALKMSSAAWKRRRNFGKFLKALPFIVLLLASWSFGELLGYLTGRPA